MTNSSTSLCIQYWWH